MNGFSLGFSGSAGSSGFAPLLAAPNNGFSPASVDNLDVKLPGLVDSSADDGFFQASLLLPPKAKGDVEVPGPEVDAKGFVAGF